MPENEARDRLERGLPHKNKPHDFLVGNKEAAHGERFFECQACV